MLLLLIAWARCDGFPVAGSIDGTFGAGNEVGYVVEVLASRRRERLEGDCPKGLQPRLDGIRVESDEAMNAMARNLVSLFI